MWFKIAILCAILNLVVCEPIFSQEPTVEKDSTQLYKDIETYSRRSGFTMFMHKLIFKPVASSTKKPAKSKRYPKLIQKPYSTFEGKIIRNIHIKTLDPFGYSIADTQAVPQNFLLRSGNSIHVKSQQIAIQNLLLFRQNQPFDSLLVKESERLVRTRIYIHDVSFFVIATSKNSDSVDIFIRTLDNWSLIPNVAYSKSSISIGLMDKNFLGFGHESKNSFAWHNTGQFAYNINYFTPNIRNTYINSTLHLSNDQYKYSTSSFAVDRPFFSPFAKWAAGISFIRLRKDSLNIPNNLLASLQYKSNTQDYWAGSAIQIFKGNTETKRTTNFISTVRFLRIRYPEKPVETNETQPLFLDENFYMASIGISTRKYAQDKYIFKFGLIEDVPIGKVYSLTGGYQARNNSGRIYLGMRFSVGNYHEWGYLSSNIEYGTFFRKGLAEQGVFSLGLDYFTGLIEIGKWKFRQFLKPHVTIGIHRLSSDSLTLNEGYGLEGFTSTSLSGTNRMLITLQTQFYAPWTIVGFRFGPYLNFSVGMLGNELTGFKHSKLYSQIGVGVLIKNEYLIFKTFQITIAFYPVIPGKGRDIFKLNSYKSTDFGFRDFEIGKPAVSTYN